MTDLITRLEQATEGSREQHIALFQEVGSFLVTSGEAPDPDFFRHLDQARRSGSDARAQRYLLCAALTLVPEGCARRQIYLPDGSYPYRVWIHKSAMMPLEDAMRPTAIAKTEALALCIAALKARESTHG
jgi:hypothetical protein